MPDKISHLGKKPAPYDQVLDSAKKHYKSLRAYALKNKRVNPDGSIDKGWLQDVAKGDDVWGKRARLTVTINDMHVDSTQDNTKRPPEEK